MYLLCVLFYDGGEYTQHFKYVRFLFAFINKGKFDDCFELKIHNRHRRIDRLTRSCGEKEQGEVSASFQGKRKNRWSWESQWGKIYQPNKSATCEIRNAELTLVAKEIQKPCNRKVKYQKVVPETAKKRSGMNAKVYGTGGQSKSTFPQDFRVLNTPLPIPLCPSSTLVRFRAIS